MLTAVTCAPITSTRRGIRSEVEVDVEQGLLEPCVINCDNLVTIPLIALDRSPVGQLSELQRAELDQALRYALDIIF